MAKVKITVLKKLSMNDIHDDNPPFTINEGIITPQCDRFEVGQEFLCDGIKCPPGFCNWAFADIQRDLVHVFFDGSYPWLKDEGVAISCCTDGVRPVIFKLERVEE